MILSLLMIMIVRLVLMKMLDLYLYKENTIITTTNDTIVNHETTKKEENKTNS